MTLIKVLATPRKFFKPQRTRWSRMSSNRFTTLILFVVFFISFPVFLVVSSIYRNSSFVSFEGLSKGREAAGESVQNVTIINSFPLGGTVVHNISEENSRGRRYYNNTVSITVKNTPLIVSIWAFPSFRFSNCLFHFRHSFVLYVCSGFINGLGKVKVLPGIFQNGTASEERNTTTNNSIASGGVGV